MPPEERDLHIASQKRKNAENHLDVGERAFKHRASQACQSCRTRKVRCDVLKNASCCTNCRLDQLDCVVLASRRGQGRRRHDRGEQSHTGRKIRSRAPRSVNPGTILEFSPTETTDVDTWNVPGGSVGSVPACVTFDDEPSSPHENDGGGNVSGQHSSVNDGVTASLSPETPYIGLLTPDTNGLQPQQVTIEQPLLPAFITPLPSSVAGEDLEYLVRKGALTLPDSDLQVEIIRAYMFSVHPFMPFLDYRLFVRAILRKGQDDRISLLLFQAVMFAGLHSLSPTVIHRLGFESAKQARAVFFHRVRLLYEFDVEPDIAANLQALLLMSSWYSQSDGRRDTWYWTGQAYDVGRRMGLHREPMAKFASERVRRFRRRLWWSLYIRDRMIALGTRRPMRIYDCDCDVTILALEDFDIDPCDEFHQGETMLPGVKENRATALMCVQLAKLCVHIGHVVSSQYSTQARDIPSTVMVVSRRDVDSAEELGNCERELSAWFEESCNAVQPSTNSTAETTGSHSCFDIHWAVLNMTYQTTVNVLHRTQALKPTLHMPDDRTVQASSRLKVKQSARSLTKLLQDMLRRDQLRFVGLIGVTAIIAAYLSHLLDISFAASDDDDVCDASKFRLYQSFEVLQAFRCVYASADAALLFLASVSQKAGVPVPMQCAGPTVRYASTLPMPTRPNVGGVNRMSVAVGDPQLASSLPVVAPLVGSQQAKQQESLLLETDGQSSSMNHSTVSGNVPAVTAAVSGTQAANATQTSSQFSGTAFGANSSSTTGYWDPLWNFDNGISSGLESSMDLGLMSFNHDFYVDSFGFTDT